MAEKKEAAAKKPAPKKVAPKAAAEKPAAKKAAAPKKEKKAVEGGLRVRQVGSPIGRRADQRATLIGLGLNKRNRERVLVDTPEVRGMIAKVQHLVVVEKA